MDLRCHRPTVAALMGLGTDMAAAAAALSPTPAAAAHAAPASAAGLASSAAGSVATAPDGPQQTGGDLLGDEWVADPLSTKTTTSGLATGAAGSSHRQHGAAATAGGPAGEETSAIVCYRGLAAGAGSGSGSAAAAAAAPATATAAAAAGGRALVKMHVVMQRLQLTLPYEMEEPPAAVAAAVVAVAGGGGAGGARAGEVAARVFAVAAIEAFV